MAIKQFGKDNTLCKFAIGDDEFTAYKLTKSGVDVADSLQSELEDLDESKAGASGQAAQVLVQILGVFCGAKSAEKIQALWDEDELALDTLMEIVQYLTGTFEELKKE